MAGLLSFSQTFDDEDNKPLSNIKSNHDSVSFPALHQISVPAKSVSPSESDVGSPESPMDDRNNRTSPDYDLSNSRNEDFFNDGGRLLTPEKANFELPSPLPMPPVLNMQYICETASRLLFLSVHWLKSITALNLQ